MPVAPMFLRNTRNGLFGPHHFGVPHDQILDRYIRDAKRELPNEHDSFIIGSVG